MVSCVRSAALGLQRYMYSLRASLVGSVARRLLANHCSRTEQQFLVSFVIHHNSSDIPASQK